MSDTCKNVQGMFPGGSTFSQEDEACPYSRPVPFLLHDLSKDDQSCGCASKRAAAEELSTHIASVCSISGDREERKSCPVSAFRSN